ncbi:MULTISPECIES: MFS transporter [Halocynthiibacter]|uniref:MFS transporter n=1 Tax=Halocynthiibacter halioticoli TaxID=2986804 RepID=A0AAE3LQ03_9RHOB|nr:MULTISPECIES: MFS transporter [Halocynthiibacter]MCV6823018.1 MFS transporter [Halocynthiibacter halioticoli]MCW4056019.1 MFS transporter [Halocynthiibacter sp. SDUM655004]
MAQISQKKRVWGWMAFDWASQPFHTLMLTFIFGPYFAEIVGLKLLSGGMDPEAAKAQAQAYWGYGLTVTGLLIAFSAPVLGAFADSSGNRMFWIKIFSAFYIFGAAALWTAHPTDFNIFWVLVLFGIGFIGVEFTTIFVNSILPSLAPKEDIGRISGSGFALGYWGGVFSLFIMLLLFAENATGKTLIGIEPLFGLDPTQREGTRFVGPFTAIWFIVAMIPFFLWVREKPSDTASGGSAKDALAELWSTIKSLPHRSSLFAFLSSSLFYRDALNGLYGFGAIYAKGVLDWSLIQIGVFGIVGAITAAVFSYVGGLVDARKGPKPVIKFSIFCLITVCIIVVGMSRDNIFGVPFPAGSSVPDIIFFICGGIIGAAGGALQASSRTMMVRHADAERPTEAFGLYALSGKATAFMAPGLIAIFSDLSGNQRIGITPLIALFTIGLVLLIWVKPQGDQTT